MCKEEQTTITIGYNTYQNLIAENKELKTKIEALRKSCKRAKLSFECLTKECAIESCELLWILKTTERPAGTETQK
jgi:hypothetical protein